MERMTVRKSDGQAGIKGYTPDSDVYARLAAYEDTGLSPEEIKDLELQCSALETIEKMYDGIGHPEHLKELSEAEADGRLVVLPEPSPDIDFRRVLDLLTADGQGRVVVLPKEAGDTSNDTVSDIRALRVAAYSLRFNPELAPMEAEIYASRILSIKMRMVAEADDADERT